MSTQQPAYLRRIQTISPHLQAPPQTVTKNIIYSTIVIGGGVIGASCAYQLSKDGGNVLLLDQYHMAHDNGSSHGDGRIIRFSYPEDIYIELAKIVYPMWKDIEKESNTKLYQMTGGIDFGPGHLEPIVDLIQNYKKHNIPYELLNKEEAEKKFPQFKFSPTDVIVYQAEGGVLYASKAVKSLWLLCKQFGATVEQNKKVDRIKVESKDLITVLCDDQTVYKGRKVVFAAGGWTNELLYRSQLNLTLRIEVSQENVFYWEPRPDTPKSIDYSQYSNPVAIYYRDADNAFYSLPEIDIKGVKCGYHHSGTALDKMGMPGDRKPYPKEKLDQIKEYIGKYNPGLNNEKESSSLHCHYTNTPDYHFIVDRHPKHSNIIITSACSGHGFKFAPAIGKLVSCMARDVPTPFDISDFSLNRFNNKSLIKRTSA
ncbi:hypothetical protein CYY_007612 [Polysphondylium violaceum]|uniref:FAD dependent oxidoreductase domain-containing protein n=1 Tax=Polysphondylium violaceum TaxID=133409 RepID=A0A8J4PQP5_9MYCE|nr:hypothetical protein CYY_007612 [Polysphondylium violaceum]